MCVSIENVVVSVFTTKALVRVEVTVCILFIHYHTYNHVCTLLKQLPFGALTGLSKL